MQKLKWLILLGLLLLGWRVQPSTAQPLPASDWYAVVYRPTTNTLHWINAAGEQATLPRPTLPDEAEYLGMWISPNGQHMVMVVRLNDNRQRLGVYDFASGQFIQSHITQPGETIVLDSENIFTANSLYFAIGLISGDFANPAWRVVLFETETGDSLAYIDQTHPNAPESQLAAPVVQYVDAMFVHFQMIPQGVGGWHTWPAYRWLISGVDPVIPPISDSPYTRTADGTDLNLLTGAMAMTYLDENYGVAPQDGQTPQFNAVGSMIVTQGTPPTTIHVDASRYLLQAKWANGGQWLLFWSTDAQQNRYWSIVLADGTPGDNSMLPLPAQIKQVYGTSDGYLLLDETNALSYTNGFSPTTAISLAQLNAGDEIVYVTPIGMSFSLEGFLNGTVVSATPDNPVQIVTATPEPVVVVTDPPPTDCSAAPAPRLSIGGHARVLPSTGTLRIRQQPNGTILTTISSNTVVSVIGGSICDAGNYWWQIDTGTGTVGWIMEGVPGDYYVEPFEGVVQPLPPAGGGDVTTEVTPIPPQPEEPLNEESAGGGEVGCERAPSINLSVGGTATAAMALNPRNSAGGETLPYVVPQGTVVTIIGGPTCANSQRWWLVQGTTVPLDPSLPALVSSFWLSDGIRAGRALRP